MRPFYRYLILFIFLFITGCGKTPAATPDVPIPNTEEPLTFKNTIVSLTFDDGYENNYQVRSILEENNLNATFYIISEFTGTKGYMTEDQLRNLYEDGNEIGGHTLNHVNLVEASPEERKREICQNRLDLLAYGFDVTSFAYPFGHYNEDVKQVVIECGYNSARTVAGGPDAMHPKDVYTLKAMPYIVNDTHFPKMTGYVLESEEIGGGWSIFTFHHVCDNCGDYMAVSLKTFSKFAKWLGEQQKNGLVVKTVGEVIGGDVKPGISP